MMAGRSAGGDTARSWQSAAWTIPGRLPSSAESSGRDTETVAAAVSAVAAASGTASVEATGGSSVGASVRGDASVMSEVNRFAAASRLVSGFKLNMVSSVAGTEA